MNKFSVKKFFYLILLMAVLGVLELIVNIKHSSWKDYGFNFGASSARADVPGGGGEGGGCIDPACAPAEASDGSGAGSAGCGAGCDGD